MIHYATYCDHRYLPRALVLLQSLREHSPPFTLWCLALSPECATALERLDAAEVRVVPLESLELADKPLLATKKSRTKAEYFFTLTSCWCEYLLGGHPEIDLLTYLDSDLCFYSSPQPLFDELGSASIGIIEHRSMKPWRVENKYGRFNVGWLSFRNDAAGRSCLRRWREQCLDWCHDRIEPTRYADQKYLDEWPSLYASLRIFGHPGVNLAPWNVAGHRLGIGPAGITVDDQPLVFFHFASVKPLSGGIVDLGLAAYGVSFAKRRWLRDHLYRDYLFQLRAAAAASVPTSDSAAFARTGRQEGLRAPVYIRVAATVANATRSLWQPARDAWSLWSGSGVRVEATPAAHRR